MPDAFVATRYLRRDDGSLMPVGSHLTDNPFQLEYLADNPDWDDLAGTDDDEES